MHQAGGHKNRQRHDRASSLPALHGLGDGVEGVQFRTVLGRGGAGAVVVAAAVVQIPAQMPVG